MGGSLHMLDLGANTLGTAEQLFQFAVMGSIVTADIKQIAEPRVALLNIGAEDTKGHDTVKDAAALLSASSLNYVGFIEGSELFSGKADVVVTDGFTGNIVLKSLEAITDRLAAGEIQKAFGIAPLVEGVVTASVVVGGSLRAPEVEANVRIDEPVFRPPDLAPVATATY